MTNNELISAVAEYIFNVTHIVEYWDTENYAAFIRPCPFSSFEEAVTAYNKHMARFEAQNEPTLDELWMERRNAFCRAKGIKRLRPRRTVR